MSGFRPRKMKRPAIDRWAIFFLTLSIIATLIALIPFFSMVTALAYYLIIGIIIIITLGIILLDENFREKLNNSENFFSNLVSLIKYSPHFAIAGASLALLATILFANSKSTGGKKGRVALGVIFTILPIIIFVVIKTRAIEIKFTK